MENMPTVTAVITEDGLSCRTTDAAPTALKVVLDEVALGIGVDGGHGRPGAGVSG